ncbi:MAG: preprotein translocase subunit YajC [Acidimicrobiia bacterium]
MSVALALAWGVLIIAGFYLIVVRPQRRRNLQHQSLVSTLAVGDEVVTYGGFIGTVTGINAEENILELQLAPNVKVNVIRDAIARKVVHSPSDDAANESSSADSETNR